MAFAATQRVINPRLGTYFSIFASLFFALFILVLIFERLGVQTHYLAWAMFLVPLALYGVFGVGTRTDDLLSFFAAGRRVSAIYGGLLLGLSAVGSTMALAGTGAFFFAGFDALLLLVGILCGLVVMAVVLAPFYRKFGAYTMPSYLGRRFNSLAIRIVCAVISVLAIAMVLIAEIKMGAIVSARLTGLSPGLMAIALGAFAGLTLVSGGSRSGTWMSVAQIVAFLMALLIVATIVSVLITSLPVPQLANGPLVRQLVRQEALQGLSNSTVWPLAFELPAGGFHALTKPYTQAFGMVGSLAFVFSTLMIGAGVATAPWLLPRVASIRGVYEARKSLGWATFFAGLTLLTLTSAAIFMRYFVFDLVSAGSTAPLPDWVNKLAQAGFMQPVPDPASIEYSGLKFDRDGLLLALPLATGLSPAFMYFLAAGVVGISLVAINATTTTLGAILSEDGVFGFSWDPPTETIRIFTARILTGVAALAGVFGAVLLPYDSLSLVLLALSITGASFFSVMVLSIWWKPVTHIGILSGMLSGFAVAALGIFAGNAGSIAMAGTVAGCLGLPVSLGVAMIISAMTKEPSRHELEIVRDIRVPGGQIIYDREMQRLLFKQNNRN